MYSEFLTEFSAYLDFLFMSLIYVSILKMVSEVRTFTKMKIEGEHSTNK